MQRGTGREWCTGQTKCGWYEQRVLFARREPVATQVVRVHCQSQSATIWCHCTRVGASPTHAGQHYQRLQVSELCWNHSVPHREHTAFETGSGVFAERSRNDAIAIKIFTISTTTNNQQPTITPVYVSLQAFKHRIKVLQYQWRERRGVRQAERDFAKLAHSGRGKWCNKGVIAECGQSNRNGASCDVGLHEYQG